MYKQWNALNWKYIVDTKWDILYYLLKYCEIKHPDCENSFSPMIERCENGHYKTLKIETQESGPYTEPYADSLESMTRFIYAMLRRIEADIRYLDLSQQHGIRYTNGILAIDIGSYDNLRPNDEALTFKVSINLRLKDTDTIVVIPTTSDKDTEFMDYESPEEYRKAAGDEAWLDRGE